MIKLTTAATVDCAAGKSSTAQSNNNSHYQCDSCGDEKILCNKKILIVESENNSENNSKNISTKSLFGKNLLKNLKNNYVLPPSSVATKNLQISLFLHELLKLM